MHETKSGIAELFAELGAAVERAALPAGDYAVGADTLIERKRVLDLHGAVLKGRLWPQLAKLRLRARFGTCWSKARTSTAVRFTRTPFVAFAWR